MGWSSSEGYIVRQDACTEHKHPHFDPACTLWREKGEQ
jgi:hypothetical protein